MEKTNSSTPKMRKEELQKLINALTDVANAGHIASQMQIVQALVELAEIEKNEKNQTELNL